MTDLFENIPQRNFKRTFLHNVMVAIRHQSTKEGDAVRNEKVDTYFQHVFKLDKPKNFFSEGCYVSNTTNDLQYTFKNDKSLAILSGDRYQNFADSLLPVIFKIQTFVEGILGVKMADEISIRKLNVWAIKNETVAELQYENVSKDFFSHDLLCSTAIDRFDKSDLDIPVTHKYEFVHENLTIFIRTTLKKLEENSEYCFLFLDIEALKTKVSTDRESLNADFLDLNKKIYNAFCWSVNPCILDIMKEK